MIGGCLLPILGLTGVACQRQHWTSHKRQCRVMANAEFVSNFGLHAIDATLRMLNDPVPSDFPLLLKLSAITWTTRPDSSGLHFASLKTRALLLDKRRPVPGDTKETLLRLLKRAVTELPWPELPQGIKDLFEFHLQALNMVRGLGEPEAAVEIFTRHLEEVERKVVAPSHTAKLRLYHLEWLLSAADKVRRDDGRKNAYLAEAKGLIERATRSLRALQLHDWNPCVSALI
jgi:hypothetical protein